MEPSFFMSHGPGPFMSEGNGVIKSSIGKELILYKGESEEPFVGMEFESDEVGKAFYYAYAERTGFTVRISYACKSKREGIIISRQFVCSKEGFCVGGEGRTPRPRAVKRQGCKALIVIRRQESGKWIVSKFEKEHNHPLMVSPSGVRRSSFQHLSPISSREGQFSASLIDTSRGSIMNAPGSCSSTQDMEDKDRRIFELTNQLKRANQLCSAYREQLIAILRDMEEQKQHLSRKVEIIESCIKD